MISERIPLFPPTLIVRIGVSFCRFLNVLSVVPSPPKVITRSSLVFLRSSNDSSVFAPSTIIGETV